MILRGEDQTAFLKVSYKTNPNNFKVKASEDIHIIYSIFMDERSAANLYKLSCAKCGSTYRVEMHHVRKMAELNPKARWVDKQMAKRNRKQIPLCRDCHMKHHRGDDYKRNIE